MKKLFFATLETIHRFRTGLALLAVTLLIAARATAQDTLDPATYEPIDINTLTPENIFDSVVEPLYGALIILFGYISAYIPGLKKLSPFYRVLTFALAAGLGFYLFGASFWKVSATYFLSSGLYAVILKHIIPSKKPTPIAG